MNALDKALILREYDKAGRLYLRGERWTREALLDAVQCFNYNTVRFMIKLGQRLYGLPIDVPQQMWNIQFCVLQCRDIVVRLLAIKKRGAIPFDRFLLRELAYEVWKTRSKHKWLTNSKRLRTIRRNRRRN